MGQEDFRQFRQRTIRLYSRMKLHNALPGERASVHSGEGIEFASIKPFEPGDDLRELDLHALAQSGEEEIIQRVMGRQMPVNIWADWSGSLQRFEEMVFPSKSQLRAIAIGLLLSSACEAYSPVGFCAYHRERTYFAEKPGQRHCEEIWDWVTDPANAFSREAADVEAAVSLLLRSAPPETLVFLLSDFHDPAFEGDFTAMLRPAARKFDLVALVIRDPLEKKASLRWPVRVAVEDNEGDGTAELYLTPQVLSQIREASARHLAGLVRNFRALGMEHVVLDSPSMNDCCQVLTAFFDDRKRTRG